MKRVKLIFVLVATLFATSTLHAQKMELGETKKVKKSYRFPIPNIYPRYETKATATFPVDQKAEIKITAGAGKMEIRPSNSKEIKVEAIVKTSSLGLKTSRKFIDRFLHLELDQLTSDRFELKSKFEAERNWKGNYRFPFGSMAGNPINKVDLVIYVPEGTYLNITDGSGPILIENIKGNIDLKDGAGKLMVKNMDGSLRLKDGSGRIEIRHFNGELDIADRSGSLVLEDIGTQKDRDRIEVSDRSGSIVMKNVKNSLRLTDRSGKTILKNISGNLEIKDRSGSLHLTDIGGGVKLKDTSGSIHLDNLGLSFDGDIGLEIIDSSGSINGKFLHSSLDIRDRSGSIRLVNINGDLFLRDRSGSVNVDGLRGEIRIRDTSGKVITNGEMVRK